MLQAASVWRPRKGRYGHLMGTISSSQAKCKLGINNVFSSHISGLIYVVGGSNDLSEELKTVESYNPITKEWITLPEMIVKRAYPGIVILDDYLYAVGGWNDNDGALNSVERLSLTAVSCLKMFI